MEALRGTDYLGPALYSLAFVDRPRVVLESPSVRRADFDTPWVLDWLIYMVTALLIVSILAQ